MSEATKSASESIREAIAKVATVQAYAALVAIPNIGWIFGLPVISQFIKAMIGRISEWVLAETAVGLSVLWVLLDLKYEVENAEQGAARLKDMLENPAKYSKEEADAIEQDFDEQTVKLIQLSIARL